jgi:hypothetical protein
MSRRSYQEDTCDRCKASEQTQSAYIHQQSEPPLPTGWMAVKVGVSQSRHLCRDCASQLCIWLGMVAT